MAIPAYFPKVSDEGNALQHLKYGEFLLICFLTVYTRPEVVGKAPAGLRVKRLSSGPAAMPLPQSNEKRNSLTEEPAEAQTPTAEEQKSSENYFDHRSITPSPLSTTPPSTSSNPTPTAQTPVNDSFPSSQLTTAPSAIQRNLTFRMGERHGHGEDSPVMNETLSVIDEHITDMNSPRHSLSVTDGRSASEYSSNIDPRLSYITGQETDEEEDARYSEQEVAGWSPAQVAEYLREAGVEGSHCDTFEEQEISGEVLLGMDMNEMRELELGGPVGRRLRTWQKIKTLQEDVRRIKKRQRGSSSFSTGDGSSEDLSRSRSRTTSNGPILPRIPSLMERPGSRQTSRQSRQHSLLGNQATSNSLRGRAGSPTPNIASALNSENLASSSATAAHNRRHSSIDTTYRVQVAAELPSTTIGQRDNNLSVKNTATHSKKPSLDRGWSMNEALSPSPPRPSTAQENNDHTFSLSSNNNLATPNVAHSLKSSITTPDLDRGYFSGGEAESRRFRNVLKKRDSASHSRQSSYNEEHKRKTSMNGKRHTRIGSADSIRDHVPAVTSPASHAYFSSAGWKNRFRSSSVRHSSTSITRGQTSPAVTNLEIASSIRSPTSEGSQDTKPKKKKVTGLRAISDAITDNEKAIVTSPTSVRSSVRESPVNSPTQTGGSSTPSISKSFEIESSEPSVKFQNGTNGSATPNSAVNRRSTKSKRDTSAYKHGLQKRTPQQAMATCDYSGWMKKKSSNLMTTWKPRLFILDASKRRLSYYYSENDDQEKGVIDISYHRVLPATQDIITGLHATITGAATSSPAPQDAKTPTIAQTEAAAAADSNKPGADGMFIFKLVPPKPGVKATFFTKPVVHFFAVDNITQGRLWMAALMKATMYRDEEMGYTSTNHQKTIELKEAIARKHRPPALMPETHQKKSVDSGLNILNLELNTPLIDEETIRKASNLDAGSSQPFGPPSKDVAAEDEERDN